MHHRSKKSSRGTMELELEVVELFFDFNDIALSLECRLLLHFDGAS